MHDVRSVAFIESLTISIICSVLFPYLTKTVKRDRIGSHRGVAQLVARLLWEQDAAGSNPVTPISKKHRVYDTFVLRCFLFRCPEVKLRNAWRNYPMKKRFLICGTVALLAVASIVFTACGRKKDVSTDAAGNRIQVYSPQSGLPVGRTAYHSESNTLWCSLSGSGIDFLFYGTECAAELKADSSYSGGADTAARYAVYVNGSRTETDQLTEAERTLKISNPGAAADACSVRIVKLSESAQSALGIGNLTVTVPKEVYKDHGDKSLIPAEPKEHLIEFIGDSITCGYGVDGEYNVDRFQTANEDATKAYAVRTAEKLGTDYSLVCYSGHGILSGYTSGGSLNNRDLVPPYYELCGHSYAALPEGGKIQDDKWDFSRLPDLIVINLGTNDSSYTGTDTEKMKKFAAAYVDFLKQIREKNPDAPILCSLGIMGTTLCDAIDLAVLNYQQETGDRNIAALRFDMQSDKDGLAVDWHPSAATYEKASDKLSAYIREWLNW